jgi:NTE family protein
MNKIIVQKSNISHKPTLGLALGGGGARGLAHIGVLKALEEYGLRPNYLAGTSMGGVIAAAYAAGIKPDEIEQIASDISKTRNLLRLADLSLPQQGIFRGERLFDFFEEKLQKQTFADLQIPLALVSVDLNSGQEVHFKEGSVAQALRASVSVPGLFAPVEYRGMRLVDGGLLNNLPADVVKRMGADIVIAVDVNWRKDSVWKSLAHLPPISGTVGGLVSVLGDSLDVLLQHQSAHKSNMSNPDFLVQPVIPAGVTTLTGYDQVAELVLSGEQAINPITPALGEIMELRRDGSNNYSACNLAAVSL